MDNLFALPLQRPCFVENFKRGFCAQSRHALRQAELVLNRFIHGQNRNYTPLVRTQRDRPLGGQAKRSWAVKSRECCEPSDACRRRGGCLGSRQRTDRMRGVLAVSV